MKRDYRARPSFAELVVELGRLVSLEQQGSDLEDCTLPVSSPAARQQSSPSGMSMPTPEVANFAIPTFRFECLPSQSRKPLTSHITEFSLPVLGAGLLFIVLFCDDPKPRVW
jgi:hypothetical protein